jgi:energy-converting hydrogenase Eha subunit B
LFPSLLLKLVVTPALIAAATLAGRRWGHALSGWLVGLPLTSAPVVFFLALDQGRHFASGAALGIILGVASQAVFALTYVWIGRSTGWPARLLAGTLGFAATTAAFRLVRMPALVEPVFVVACLVVAIRLMPRIDEVAHAVAPPPGDLPMRMVVATVLVIGLTAMAPDLGSYLSGLVTPFPLYAAILAVFAHRSAGPAAATAVWRGLLFGLFSFLVFFSVLAATLVGLGLGLSFLLAIAAATTVQAASLMTLRFSARSAN